MPEPLNLIAAQIQDFELFNGDTLAITLVFGTTLLPLDLSGALVEMTVRNTPFKMTSASVDGGINIGGTGNNQVSFTKPIDLSKGQYKYVMKITFADGRKITFMYGRIIVDDNS